MLDHVKATWICALLLCVQTALADPTNAVLKATILDATTGQPTACSVALTDSHGVLVTETEAYKAGFRCSGLFEKSLPRGRTRLRVTRGPETRAFQSELDLNPGTNELTIKLERNLDLRKRGWFSGDSHDHMIHGEKTIPTDFDYVALAARSEDLQYMSLSHTWTLANPTPEALERELGARSLGSCLLTWNLEAPKNYYLGDASRCLGHCWSIGTRGRTANGENVIQVLLAASAWDYESSKPTYANFESHALIHAQGGTVFYSHPLRWWMDEWGGQGGYPKQTNMRVSNMAIELPLDTLLGPTFDGLDVITTDGEVAANEKAFQLWSMLLNHGYRLAATASSDACFDRPGGAVPGAARTYTWLEGEFSIPAVARATAEGKTFATTGPLLIATVDGKPPGSTFAADGREHRLDLEAWASGAATDGLSRIEICRNGKLLNTIDVLQTATVPVSLHKASTIISERETAWYCVRAWGANTQQRAITGAFYFVAPGTQPPAPVKPRVQARIIDVTTGQPVPATLIEVTYYGTLSKDGAEQPVPSGEINITIPGTARLRAEAPGYKPLTLSPVFDNPFLVQYITHLEDKDLLDWQTFERTRELLNSVALTFKLSRE